MADLHDVNITVKALRSKAATIRKAAQEMDEAAIARARLERIADRWEAQATEIENKSLSSGLKETP